MVNQVTNVPNGRPYLLTWLTNIPNGRSYLTLALCNQVPTLEKQKSYPEVLGKPH
jgi:hypothetical protein